jgi:hypothetical protein
MTVIFRIYFIPAMGKSIADNVPEVSDVYRSISPAAQM